MATVAQTAKTSRLLEETDWLAMFPAEDVAAPGELERPPTEDPFEWFPLERHLLDRPSVILPTRQVPPAPRPAEPMAGRPSIVDPWRPPRPQLTRRGWLTLTAIAVVPMLVMWRLTIQPPLPDVSPALVVEMPGPIEVPVYALAAPRTSVGGAAAKPTVAAAVQPTTPQAAKPATGKPPADAPRAASGNGARTQPVTSSPAPPIMSALVLPVSSANAPPASARTESARLKEPTPAAVVPSPSLPLAEATAGEPTAAAGPRAADTTAIEEVLGRYRGAYAALDAGAVQKTFPRVDRKSLDKSFAELQQQSLKFDDCQIDITGRDARAACRGSAEVVSKGSARSRVEARRWDFTLSKIGSSWLILSAQSKR